MSSVFKMDKDNGVQMNIVSEIGGYVNNEIVQCVDMDMDIQYMFFNLMKQNYQILQISV